MEGAFARIASMQVANGNFSMWGDDGDVVPYITPYVADFLLDASEGGFAVPDTVLQKALNRLSEDLLSGGNQFYGSNFREHLRFANQAYAGYVLARVGPCAAGYAAGAVRQRPRQGGRPACRWSTWGWRCRCRAMPSAASAAPSRLAFAKSSSDRPAWLRRLRHPAIRDDALMLALVRERKLAKPPEDDARGRSPWAASLDARRNAGWFWLSTQEQVAIARLGKALAANQPRRSVAGELG